MINRAPSRASSDSIFCRSSVNPPGHQLVDARLYLRRLRYGASHGVGLLHRLPGLEGTYAVVLTAPSTHYSSSETQPVARSFPASRSLLGASGGGRFADSSRSCKHSVLATLAASKHAAPRAEVAAIAHCCASMERRRQSSPRRRLLLHRHGHAEVPMKAPREALARPAEPAAGKRQATRT